ncbi:uncharacterized protein LOC129319777 [Prosopis cineraria]|uniref:uncharacterized protein LOC129319777 n=1 Tax=Prosopis cineraria TaxID=364024 RepID=UPI00240F96E0|nr:uncharacterized protein LOC129319777 [Prosopis cineraria]
MNSDKGKAVWNSTLTEIFIKECLEQVYKKQRKGTAFNKNGWQAIIEGFEVKTGKSTYGVTNELLGLNVTTNTGGTSGDRSQGKRKRVVGVNGRKKQKVPASMKIADAMSEMAKDNRARTETVNKILANDIIVSEVVAHLNGLPEVFGDKDLHWRCVNLVLYKPMRDAYWQLKDHPDHLVNWLKH